MACQLTFKKAFGLKDIPVNYAMWLLELKDAECKYSIGNKDFSVKIGTFGTTQNEKILLSYFFHSDERDLQYIHEVLTLDIAFAVDLSIPGIPQQDGPRNTTVDNLVAPFIQDAFNAASRFIDAYRSVKYRLKRASTEWRERKLILVPEMAEAEFRTYLFYHLQNDDSTFVGCFSEGQTLMSFSTDNVLICQKIQNVALDEIPLSSKLIVKAWEYLFQDDYRNCVIYAATVLELSIVKALRSGINSKSVASNSQIDKFLDNVSNRLLCTVMLGLFGIGDEKLREKIADVFEIRNGLVHGKKKKATRAEAETVLTDTEALLDLLERQSEML